MVVAIAIVASCSAPSPGAITSSRNALEGGRALAACDFPSVGQIDSSCTATLIDARWILTAAHCPTGSRFRVGSLDAGITRCERHPEFDGSGRVFDFMVCELDAALDAVAVVPLLAPCEAAALRPADEPRLLPEGMPVFVVGMGAPASGTKRGVEMEVSAFVFSPPLIDFDDPLDSGGSRPGDSGGPTFARLDDGTWRQVGVHHLGGVGSSVNDVFVAAVVPWIESTTRIDATPCHAADAWSPSAACDDLPSVLEGGGGTFPGCTIGRVAPAPTCAPTDVDAGPAEPDAGSSIDDDAGSSVDDDAGSSTDDDAGSSIDDAGTVADAGSTGDASAIDDAGSIGDAGPSLDAGSIDDAGASDDDARPRTDAAIRTDASTDPTDDDGGCGCRVAGARNRSTQTTRWLALLALLGMATFRGRQRRSRESPRNPDGFARPR